MVMPMAETKGISTAVAKAKPMDKASAGHHPWEKPSWAGLAPARRRLQPGPSMPMVSAIPIAMVKAKVFTPRRDNSKGNMIDI